MIASILWKEYREQRAIWLALALLAVGAIVGVPLVLPPDAGQEQSYRDFLGVVSVVLAWTYGLVCGGMLLAGEREAGTQEFLDTLPVPRLRVWKAKILAGGVLLLLMIALLAVLGAVQRLVEPSDWPVGLFALLYAGVVSFGWTLVFSARAGSVMSAIGQALLGQALVLGGLHLVVAVVVGLLGAILFDEPFSGGGGLALVLASLIVFVLCWPVSAAVYGARDRSRLPPTRLKTLTTARGWGVSWWLARSRLGGFVVGLALFSLAAGLQMIASGLVFWPLLSLIVGAVCGVTVFLDEQSGAYRFLGDQRLPLWPLWLLKSAVRLVLGLGALALMALPSVVVLVVDLGNRPLDQNTQEKVLGRLFGSPLIGLTVPVGLFLFAPVVYGFVLGQLCGVVFRKPLVALFAAIGLGLLLLGVWVPSLLTGGVRPWQVMLVPIVILVGAWLLLRPWAGDRLASWSVAARLGGTGLACTALTVVGLGYRVVEVPDAPEPEGLREFVASLPSIEENEAGQLLRGALSQLEGRVASWSVKTPTKPLFPGEMLPLGGTAFTAQLHAVVMRGWPPGPVEERELAGWLNAVFKDESWRRIAAAARKPVGMIDDPRRRIVGMRETYSEVARTTAEMLAARGLMKQRQGEPGVFVDDLDQGLAIVRNLSHGGTELSALVARWIEATLLVAVQRWLEALDGQPDLLRRIGEVLDRHRAWVPSDPRDAELADYLIGRNSLDDPASWLKYMLPSGGRRRVDLNEPALLASAWRVPWERERQQRLWRAAAVNPDGIARRLPESYRLSAPIAFLRSGRLRKGHPRRFVRLDATRLMVALRHHQAAKGKPADTLDALVPGSIAAIPRDPFDRKPFRYRLSKGETIEWSDESPGSVGGHGMPAGAEGPPPPALPPIQTRKVPAGQGILWSVGEDRQDDGGKRQGLFPNVDRPTEPGEDLIYLVPLPAKQE